MGDEKVTRVEQFYIIMLYCSSFIGSVNFFLYKYVICQINYDDD